MKYPLKIYFFIFIVWYLAFLILVISLVTLINIYFYLFVLKLNVAFISLFDGVDVKFVIFMPILCAFCWTIVYLYKDS